MEAEIRKFNPESEYYTPEQCFINELSNGDNDPGVSIALATVKPGITTRWHRLHGTTERYVILEGEGLVEAGSLNSQKLQKGDVVLIPPLCRQRISNIGNQDLVFLAICSPRFRLENYEDIEDET